MKCIQQTLPCFSLQIYINRLIILICRQAWVAFNGGTLGDAPASVQIAIAKCALPWRTAFLRAVMGNWIVCMSILMATGSSSLASKMVAIFFPISAFVMLGLEHSIANLFLVPLGMMRGGTMTTMDFLMKNLLPVTLGNIVGGAICVGLSYSCIHGSFLDRRKQ
jgi:formate transporter